MKTFFLNIPRRLRIESQKLDAQAILCDRAWTVFNDEGIKQLFIFQTDGSLLITINGVVYNSTWKYVPVNNSVVITSEGKSTMYHPAFMDSIVFALELDGGSEYLFMIDEVNQKVFTPKTLSELNDYFKRKEELLLEREEEQKRQKDKDEKERVERAKRDAHRIIPLTESISILKENSQFYLFNGKDKLTEPLTNVFADSLVENCFLSAKNNDNLVVFFLDKDRVIECFTWGWTDNMDYYFSQKTRTIWTYYGYKTLPVLQNSCGRIYNHGHTVDIIKQPSGKYEIVEHEYKIQGDKYPTMNLLVSIGLAALVSAIIVFVIWGLARALSASDSIIVHYLGAASLIAIPIGVIYSFLEIPSWMRDSYEESHTELVLLPVKSIWKQD